MSLLGRRLLATLIALWVVALSAATVLAGAVPDSTWVALKALPRQGHAAVFALAVDPSNNQAVLAGNSAGSLLRSADGGATWTTAHSGAAVLTTIAFSPYTAGLVLAGTRGSGALVSRDGGVSWSAAAGIEGRAVRVFGFALTLAVAGTDRGVYLSPDGVSWKAAGLGDHSINSIAVEAIHSPVRLVVGTDSLTAGAPLPLYQSVDAGATWTSFSPPISGTFAVKLAAGPLPPTGNVRPLEVGTNAGLFQSMDNGSTFTPLSGGRLLPTTDYTQVTFITDHFDRFYAGSDGGGSGAGGLWRTDDAGQTFASLSPPVPSVTALAVSNDESPTLYVATFDPSTQVATIWAYHDTGGVPQAPGAVQSPVASGTRTARSGSSVLDLLGSSQAPYIALGVAALLVILAAFAANVRGRRR